MECSDSTFGIFKLFLLMENIFVDKDKSKITTSMKIKLMLTMYGKIRSNSACLHLLRVPVHVPV
jgi:hypothetical protein